MTKNEMRSEIKNLFVEDFLSAFPTAVQIDDFKYVVPIEYDGTMRYAKIDICACQWYDTKTIPAFDLDTALELYEEKKAEKAAKAAERAKK